MPNTLFFIRLSWFTVCFCCVLWFPHLSWGQPQDHTLDKVHEYLKSQYKEKLSDPKSRTALAIGAPEIIRYHYFRDFLETISLEILYINQGSKQADFSIGPFQMKPSFVEMLEEKLTKWSTAEFCQLTEYHEQQASLIRKERLIRMQQTDYQLQYLLAFSYVCQKQFGDYLKSMNAREKLRFMATAYNLGLNNPANVIQSYARNAYFPFGKGYSGKQYAYGELAIQIFKKLNN